MVTGATPARATKTMRHIGQIDIQFTKGVGEKRAEVLRAYGIETLEDLLYLFPRRYLDRTRVTPLRDLQEGEQTTVVGKIISCDIQKGRRSRFVALVGDGTGFIQCVWFQNPNFWKRVFKPGESYAFHGKIGYYNGFQLVHPEYDKLTDAGEQNTLNTGAIVPLYSSSEALAKMHLDSRGFRRLIRTALQHYAECIRDGLPEEIRRRQELVTLPEALHNVHFPESNAALAQARKRLKFDEFFYLQLILALRRKKFHGEETGIAFREVGDKTRHLVENLSFSLTTAQRRVLREIWADMKSTLPMNRLIQGDVGSGKTIVALIAMLMAVENGYQAAIMAPTEILAEQHYLTMHSLLERVGVRVLLLIGGARKSEREKNLQAVAAGEVDVIIGTHALIQPDVRFHKLGLVVVDEQHRFGVLQRAALKKKGRQPDVLVMTATPIPRTLSMTLYGDLDVSVLDELPAGRKPIRTVWRSGKKRKDVYEFIRSELAYGAQAYIVFPLVEESEKLELRAATETFERVKDGYFSDFAVGLIHGRMSPQEKEQVMAEFKAGAIQLLIATTVIEVGVDVPNASIMLIEHAERFGLTQLHQIRGRVGRGEKESLCILLVETPLSAEARRRIATMCETNDGFRIAEVDLELRGPGEYFGTKQHGLPDFKIADLTSDSAILEKAREEAFRVAEDEEKLRQVIDMAGRFRFFQRYRENMELAKVG